MRVGVGPPVAAGSGGPPLSVGEAGCAAGTELATVARSVLRLARLLERTDAPLTPAQYRLAAHIRAGDVRATRLACALALSKPTVTQSVDSLVSAGYLRREEVDGDRRATRLVLTGPGEEALAATEAAYATRLASLLCPGAGPALPAAVVGRLVDSLGQLDALLDARLAAASATTATTATPAGPATTATSAGPAGPAAAATAAGPAGPAAAATAAGPR